MRSLENGLEIDIPGNNIEALHRMSEMEKKKSAARARALEMMKSQAKTFNESEKIKNRDLITSEDAKEENLPTCISCRQSDSESLAYVGLAVESNVLKCHSNKGPQICVEDFDKTMQPMGVNIGHCGHMIHYSCFLNYLSPIKAHSTSFLNRIHKDQIDLENFEFLCPLCKTLSNILIPYSQNTKLINESGLETHKNCAEWTEKLIEGFNKSDDLFGDFVSSEISQLKSDILYFNVNLRMFTVGPDKREMGPTNNHLNYHYFISACDTLVYSISSLCAAESQCMHIRMEKL
eukprot:CAMPEP_0171457142 /NCGR_PEP_ID=MMETSP0945-20130129/3339_1 /TAXON_ID=109269 /ORGANISM="Vaucheria litorea, Strain CCMP2940" /LENGTH=290 /DNA_ID=CAMNT_0011982691 /DNA_START=22 /DNA_END=894 /DNA_ORIENTATION=+